MSYAEVVERLREAFAHGLLCGQEDATRRMGNPVPSSTKKDHSESVHVAGLTTTMNAHLEPSVPCDIKMIHIHYGLLEEEIWQANALSRTSAIHGLNITKRESTRIQTRVVPLMRTPRITNRENERRGWEYRFLAYRERRIPSSQRPTMLRILLKGGISSRANVDAQRPILIPPLTLLIALTNITLMFLMIARISYTIIEYTITLIQILTPMIRFHLLTPMILSLYLLSHPLILQC